MWVVLFLCCLHLVESQAVPRGDAHPRGGAVPRAGAPLPDFGTQLRLPEGIPYSKSSGRENTVKNPHHVPEFLPFATNAQGVPRLSIKKVHDSLRKPTKQADKVVTQTKRPNLDGLTIEQIIEKVGPPGNKPQPKARNPPPGFTKRQVSPAFPRTPVGDRVAKDEH